MRRSIEHEVEGQRNKVRPKRTWKKLVEEENGKVDLLWKKHFIVFSGMFVIINCESGDTQSLEHCWIKRNIGISSR